MTRRRILVTGSRSWAHFRTVDHAILEACAALNSWPDGVIVVHGAATAGADRQASNTCQRYHIPQERHPAVWRPGGKFDPLAGFKRNQEMVGLGAEICLAFANPCSAFIGTELTPRSASCKEPGPHATHGTRDCMGRAMAAGIPIWLYKLGSDGKVARVVLGPYDN